MICTKCKLESLLKIIKRPTGVIYIRRKTERSGTMSQHNISALVVAITVLFVIVGFTIYFNNPGLNKAWAIQQQKDKDMLVLGVHSPEFTFEKNHTNLKAAVQRFGITNPAIAATTIENHSVTMKINKT